MPTLEAFNSSQFQQAKIYLATQVADMMGRKLEEEDWSKVYRFAKGIPKSGWSNLSIDVMHGALGVEHKMMRFNDNKPILDACGTSLMHPAGTRAIRIPIEEDATLAARDVLRQYADLIAERSAIVRVVHAYNHGLLDRPDAVMELVRDARMTQKSANDHLPLTRCPVGSPLESPDMRHGWLLWQSDLREFLYFEEPMNAPQPNQFFAEWRTGGGGRRWASRTLWVYHQTTGQKCYSITTDAGAKIQPYFKVPPPNDPNLYHWIVQGESLSNGKIRVWLSQQTAALLSVGVGSIESSAVSDAIRKVDFAVADDVLTLDGFGRTAVGIEVEADAYQLLCSSLNAVGDEHRFRLLAEILGK